MFGWHLLPASCPVDPNTRDWIESRVRWLVDQFGLERVRALPVVLPNREFFPDRYEPSRFESVRALLDRVCELMEVDPSRVELVFHSDHSKRVVRGGFVGSDGLTHHPAGVYRAEDVERISIDTGLLSDPHAVVATMAHELGHVLLLGDGRISDEVKDHEPLTDLLTVVLGFGLFTANCVVRERNWQVGSTHGWHVGRLGYLLASHYGYALALFAWTRGETKPRWTKLLRPDVAVPFRKGLRYLRETGDSLFVPHAPRGRES
jgi:hypothetical protein